MVDPTAIQATAKEREIKEGLLKLCCETSRTRFKLRKFSDAIYFGEQALLHCHELGNKEAQNLHRKLLLYYISQSNHILLAQGGDSEEAFQSAKLALKQSKGVEGEESRRSACKSLALVFLELQDFGASINREEWLSYFEENDDTEEKHDAQWTKWTMTSAYYKQALNSLNNKQFKEASDDGEQALVSYKDDKSLTIKIRWLLVLAYFLQNDFKDALEQFNNEPDMLSLKLDVDDYIKAGKIHHQKMRRYNEAKMCFEKAKKDANSKLKSIQKANESIKDDVPQMLKNIGEIDIEKHGNKKEIEEQTFCHTEENIKKEASGEVDLIRRT